MTTALPDVKVEIYSALYTSWNDVSTWVRLDDGVRMKRGRASQFDTSSPGTCSFTLVIGDTGDPGLFAIGGGYANALLKKNTPVRVSIDAVQVWQGFIDTVTWRPGVGTVDSTVEVTCTDEFKKYAKMRLGPYGVERQHQVMGTFTGATYPLALPRNGVGSFWHAHRDPTASPIRIYGGSAGHYEPSSESPPYVGSSVRMFPWTTIGPWWEHPTSFDPGSEEAVVSIWFRTDSVDGAWLFRMHRTSGGTGYAEIILESDGDITATVTGDGGATCTSTKTGDFNDDQWHHVAVWFQPTTGTKLSLYVDGVLNTPTVNTGGTAATISSSNRRAAFGAKPNTGWTDSTYCIDGYLAVPGLYKITSGTPLPLDVYAAGMTGDTDEVPETRIELLGNALPSSSMPETRIELLGNAFCGAALITTANMSGYTITGQDTTDRTYLELAQEVADSEQGIFYIDRLGDPKLRGSGARATGASVTLTVSATQDLTGPVEAVLDDALYANTVVATSPSGSVAKRNSTAVTADGGALVDNWSCLLYDETEMGTAAQRRLDLRKSAKVRLGRIVIDLLSTPNSIQSTTLQLVPLDRVSVTSLDANVFGATTFDGFVEGWEVEVSTSRFTCSLDMSPVE